MLGLACPNNILTHLKQRIETAFCFVRLSFSQQQRRHLKQRIETLLTLMRCVMYAMKASQTEN